jgi:hypothetical protein
LNEVKSILKNQNKNKKTMKLQRLICLTTALLFMVAVRPIRAGEPDVNPNGTWKVTIITTNLQVRPAAQTLKLKLDGGTLTGTLTYNSSPTVNGKARVSELPITEAKLQGDLISFNFTHPPAAGNGPNAIYGYQGKISGDIIKGTFTMEWMGQSRTRDWEAERLKE